MVFWTFFAMDGCIEDIFRLQLCQGYLQINFEFRSTQMILDGVIALELRILTVFRTFLCYGWTYREHFWFVALS